MARRLSVFTEPQGRRRNDWLPNAYGADVITLFLLALIGFVAVVVLILGLLNVHWVTQHFNIH